MHILLHVRCDKRLRFQSKPTGRKDNRFFYTFQGRSFQFYCFLKYDANNEQHLLAHPVDITLATKESMNCPIDLNWNEVGVFQYNGINGSQTVSIPLAKVAGKSVVANGHINSVAYSHIMET